MPVKMKMWRMDGAEPRPLTRSALPAERDLHTFLERDPSLLGERLLVIGSEVITPHGARLDLLAVDIEGNLHLLELKRNRTSRKVIAQVLDYGAWASTLSQDAIVDLATRHLDRPFEVAFEEVFGLFTVEGVADVVWGSARWCLGRGRGLPRMKVPTRLIWKTSTCTTLPRQRASAALT